MKTFTKDELAQAIAEIAAWRKQRLLGAALYSDPCRSVLRGTDLRGTTGIPEIPIVENIDAQIPGAS